MNYKDLKPSDFILIPKGEKLKARVLELDVKNSTEIFIFSEEEGVYTCLIAVDSDTYKLPDINGLFIRYEQFAVLGSEMKQYISLECRTKSYALIYTEILKEILSEFDNSALELLKVIMKVISKWRHFLAQPKIQILKESEIVGLIGELMFLSKLINNHPEDALSSWTADEGMQDFTISGRFIEVKTSTREMHEHIINGLDQLLVDPNTSKFILSLLISPSKSLNSISLPKIVQQCSDLLVDFPEIFDMFFKKLLIRGYDVRDQAHYSEFLYEYRRGAYFNIDESFPKLTSHQLAGPLNARITKVRYNLDMDGLPCKDFISTDLKCAIDII